jgi:exodeoxyribonuclease-3
MKIATSNINNINRRLPNLLGWLQTSAPEAGVDRDVRGQEGASDYAPAWIVLR